MENNQNYQIAVERVARIRKFYKQLLIFLVVFGMVYGDKILKYNLSQNPSKIHISFFIIIWFMVLFIKGIKLFVFNMNWETDKINKELKKINHGKY